MGINSLVFNFSSEKRFKEAFLTYYPRLCLYAFRILRNQGEAEDIVQNVFISFWDNQVTVQDIEAIKPFLYRSVYNACMNHIRHQDYVDRQMEHFEEEGVESNAYLVRTIENEIMDEIFRVIDTLPTECSKIFRMSYVEGMDIQKVADRLGISVNTVKTQRMRARKLLKERLKNLFPLFMLLFSA